MSKSTRKKNVINKELVRLGKIEFKNITWTNFDNFGLRKKLFRMNVLRCFVFVCPRFVMDIIILTIKKMASNAFAFVDGYST